MMLSDCLSIESLSAGYAGKPILANVTITPIKPGEVLALTGPNGAGKSTLLKAIAGFLPVSGRVTLGCEDIAALKAYNRAGRISYMPQTLPRAVGLTVFESVVSALRIVSKHASRPVGLSLEHTAAMLIERLGMTSIASNSIDMLSGGQRQMAALAQALVGNPSVLLLDEPTSALDLRHQDEFMRTIRNVAETGTIVIVVMHELMLAARMADRVAVLANGQIEVEGCPATVFTSDILDRVWGVEAEVTQNSRGNLQIDILGPSRRKLQSNIA